MSVRPSVCMYQCGCHCIACREIWYWSRLRKSVKKLKIWLNSEKIIGHFKWRLKTLFLTAIRNILCLEYRGNSLYFCGNAEYLRGWEIYTMYVNNGTKGTVVTFPWQRWELILLRDIWKISNNTKGTVVTFPWQQWLCGCATMLRWTHIACFVLWGGDTKPYRYTCQGGLVWASTLKEMEDIKPFSPENSNIFALLST
jgi:hypothetical protein